jgi:lysophospholipase L1-like esterase
VGKGPTDPAPTPTAISYTALGASDAIGIGSSSPCIPFSTCPDGTGYVQIVARRLREANPDMAFLNLGIPGAVLSRDIMNIGNNVGRGIPANFIDGEMPFVAKNSTLVTVFADANGVNAIGAALRPMAAADRPAYAQTQIQNFARDFSAFAAGISGRAPAAKIIVLNMPNLARLPYASGYSAEDRLWLRELSIGFTAAINATRSSGVLVVDLMCHAPIYQSSVYSSDGFHPNDAGYRALADLVTAAITTNPVAPPTTCSFMS